MNKVSDEAECDYFQRVIDAGSFSWRQWAVILLALLLNMLDGFDVTAMAFTVHSIGEQLQISPDFLGAAFSAALGGMMAGAMFIAPLSDVYGRRVMIIICVLVIGLSMCATAFAVELWQLVVLRLITGLGVGGMLAALATITAEYTPSRYRSLAVVFVTAGYPLGATAGGFLAAEIIPEFGWEAVFLSGGGATLVMLVFVVFLMPESLQFLATRRPRRALERTNLVLKKLGRDTLDSLPQLTATSVTDGGVLKLLAPDSRRQTLLLWMTVFCCYLGLYFLMSWIPKLVVDAGLSEVQGAYSMVAFNGGAVAGIILLGWMSSKIGLSRLISQFLFFSGAAMFVFALASGIDQLFVYLVLIGFFAQGGFTGLYAVAAKLYPTEVRTTGVGWAIGLGRFGAVLAPSLGGLLIARGVSMEANFMIFAVPFVFAGVFASKLKVA